jgi:hypothetical protein
LLFQGGLVRHTWPGDTFPCEKKSRSDGGSAFPKMKPNNRASRDAVPRRSASMSTASGAREVLMPIPILRTFRRNRPGSIQKLHRPFSAWLAIVPLSQGLKRPGLAAGVNHPRRINTLRGHCPALSSRWTHPDDPRPDFWFRTPRPGGIPHHRISFRPTPRLTPGIGIRSPVRLLAES